MTKVVLILVANAQDAEIAAQSMFIKTVNRASMSGVLYSGDRFVIRDRHHFDRVRGLELITYLTSPSVKLNREEETMLKAMTR